MTHRHKAGSVLTPAQRDGWARDGYLVLPDFIAEADGAALRRRAAELVDAFEPVGMPVQLESLEYEAYVLNAGDRIHYFLEPDAVAPDGTLLRPKHRAMGKIGRALHDLDPVFDAFCRTPRLATLAADLEIRRPLLLQSQYIFKQPGIGRAFFVHQDATFMVTEPPSVVAFWFALEDADEENACLHVLPGAHRSALRSRFRRMDGGDSGVEVIDPSPWPEERFVPVAVRRNSLVLMHGLLPHFSPENRSQRTRESYVLHVIDGTCRYPSDNWLRRGPELPMRGF
ncbi:phytanoyl-CoA dioxygenase family protein [Azospirillum sp. TSA6c]|uniref:phytanoyl-CoA dioxygenase family protein n=1 Tax=unclassified Azospirillum TaxID=2630922 RepID=UPI000D6212A1|nr:phytanoyl-CoA dioxygenase family protein [Azospirillum sp. TSA6c]PWC47103.1 hypothetical protein TSA6c_10405 [Azospirillum sp. TSA6c]